MAANLPIIIKLTSQPDSRSTKKGIYEICICDFTGFLSVFVQR